MSRAQVPILLLKTRTQPTDSYAEYFTANQRSNAEPCFEAHFIPVLSHARNRQNLSHLEALLRQGQLKEKYGGVIFTSQRAVEGWSDVVKAVAEDPGRTQTQAPIDPDHWNDSLFPLYVVGPATQKTLTPSLQPLMHVSPALNPIIYGQHTGNGAALADFMLQHYNHLHAQHVFAFFEAPRLPFIPLLGAGGENYSRRRLDKDDARLKKRPLLFLVGEQRRDVIPKTLQDEKLGEDGISVEEMEVYSTTVMESFKEDFEQRISCLNEREAKLIVVVVFSPQGCESMLQSLGWLGEDGKVNDRAGERWGQEKKQGETSYVVATIGPTTRDFLKREFGFDADVCATKPSPEGVGEGVREFLKEKGLV